MPRCICRVKKQPSRDNLPSKGEQTVKDSPASQGSHVDTTTSSNSSNVSSPKSARKVTANISTKGFHTIRSIALPYNTQTTSFHAMRHLSAESKHADSFKLRDQNDTSRDTAAAAEAKNAAKGVASGSTRKDASDTGRPSEAAPTASEVNTHLLTEPHAQHCTLATTTMPCFCQRSACASSVCRSLLHVPQIMLCATAFFPDLCIN